MGLNSILTGQNRIIQGVFGRIAETLPSIPDPDTHAAYKIEQSLRNSFGLVKAMEDAGILAEAELLPERIRVDPKADINVRARQIGQAPLTEDEEAQVNEIIMDVLGFILSLS